MNFSLFVRDLSYNSDTDIKHFVFFWIKMDVDSNSGESKIEIVRGQNFDVGPRYTNLAYIGEGAYGMVV